MNANQLNELTNVQLTQMITERGWPKMKGRPNKDAMVAYIIERQAEAVPPIHQTQMCRECGERPHIIGESLCAECWTDDEEEEEEEEVEEEEETDNYQFNDCEDCGNEFDNEGNPTLRFCENCDDHHPHNETDDSSQGSEEAFNRAKEAGPKIGGGGASCEDCGNNREDNGECFDCEIAPNIVGGEVAEAEAEPIFNGDRCPVCLDEDCDHFTNECLHMLCGGCYEMLPNPRKCPICRIPISGVSPAVSDEQKIAEWGVLKRRIAELEAMAPSRRGRAVARYNRIARGGRAVRRRAGAVAVAVAVAVGGGGGQAEGDRPRGVRANEAPEVPEGGVLGDLHFSQRARLRCEGDGMWNHPDHQDGGCRNRTRRVCPQCRNVRLCEACGERCPHCV